jgi:hypothetical protein
MAAYSILVERRHAGQMELKRQCMNGHYAGWHSLIAG